MSDLTAARIQMEVSLAFHMIFAAVGMAMPLMMLIAEGRWLRMGDAEALRLAKTWAKVTAVLFAIGLQVIGFYLGQSTVSSSYGAAGSIMILLLWVYYSCQIVLFGAEFTRVWAARHGSKPKPSSFAMKDPDAVQAKSALTSVD